MPFDQRSCVSTIPSAGCSAQVMCPVESYMAIKIWHKISTKLFINSTRHRYILWCQIGVFLIEHFQFLRCVSLERSFTSQTLEDNCAQRPEIGLCIIMQWHYHLGCLFQRDRERFEFLDFELLISDFHRRTNDLTIYMGEPHSVAAILPSCKNRAKPKSAILRTIFDGDGNVLP